MFRDILTRTRFLFRRGWFAALWLFIGAVSAIDTYLIFRFRDLMWRLEENPVGRYLIELDEGNVTVFILTKIAGTVVVMSVLAGLHVYRRRMSFPVTASVAAFQLRLLVYVALSAPVYQLPGASEGAVAAQSTPGNRAVWEDISAYLPPFDEVKPSGEVN